jgi:hypothetical protein
VADLCRDIIRLWGVLSKECNHHQIHWHPQHTLPPSTDGQLIFGLYLLLQSKKFGNGVLTCASSQRKLPRKDWDSQLPLIFFLRTLRTHSFLNCVFDCISSQGQHTADPHSESMITFAADSFFGNVSNFERISYCLLWDILSSQGNKLKIHTVKNDHKWQGPFSGVLLDAIKNHFWIAFCELNIFVGATNLRSTQWKKTMAIVIYLSQGTFEMHCFCVGFYELYFLRSGNTLKINTVKKRLTIAVDPFLGTFKTHCFVLSSVCVFSLSTHWRSTQWRKAHNCNR